MDWRLVLDHLRGGYAPGFDPNVECAFKRVGDGEDKAAIFRMRDQDPAFNIAGLLWRPSRPEPDTAQQQAWEQEQLSAARLPG